MRNIHRPTDFKGYIGQKRIKSTLQILLNSSIRRKAVMDHIFLHGFAGTGKTTLANIIAKKLDNNIRYVQGPLLEKKSDILSLFGSIQEGHIIFIDEIHGVNKNVEELLYIAMEDFAIDVNLGPEGDSKIVRMKLPKFTLIGATTKISMLSKPLKDRFGIVFRLEDYSDADIAKIIKINFKKLKFDSEDDAVMLISKYVKSTPRLAINMVKRVVDFAIDNNQKTIDLKIARKTLKYMGIYLYGLTDMHIQYLKTLQDTFEEKYVSLDTIKTVLNESRENIELEIEPILSKYNLIHKSSRGRKISSSGMNYLLRYNFYK